MDGSERSEDSGDSYDSCDSCGAPSAPGGVASAKIRRLSARSAPSAPGGRRRGRRRRRRLWAAMPAPRQVSPQRRPPRHRALTPHAAAAAERRPPLRRRAASLDAIHPAAACWSDPYSPYYCSLGPLGPPQHDKATQTEDGAGKSTPTPTSEDKFDKFLRHRLQRPPPPTYRPAASAASTTSTTPTQTMSPIFFQSFKGGNGAPLRAARSSVEGLNQEIERLVLCPTPTRQLDQRRDRVTPPEGHRAPLAELLRRSVNTQTPGRPDRRSHSAHSSGPPSRESPSGGCSPERRGPPGGSVSSSPDLDANRLGTSPHINRFLAREPPDGCEKVNLNSTTTTSKALIVDLSPIKPSVGFQLRPSLGSAFQPLQPPNPPSTAFPPETRTSDDE